jgi:hypothetical protein
MRTPILMWVFALAILVFPACLNASLINSTAFSGNETLIDFSTPFQRTSSPVSYDGVTFRVVEWAGTVASKDLAAQNDWGDYFSNIPGASGGYALNDFTGNTQLRIEFAMDVNRVGLLLSTSSVTSWSMVAWDKSGAFIEAQNASMPRDANAVFLGLETNSSIAYVDIIQFQNDGLVTLFDDIRFESTTPVPLPSAALLFGSGLMMVWGRVAWGRWKRKSRETLIGNSLVLILMLVVCLCACVAPPVERPPAKSQTQLEYEQTEQQLRQLHKRGIEFCTSLGPANSMEQLKIIMDCIEKMNAIDAQYLQDLSTLERQQLEQMNQPHRSGWIWVFPPNGSPYPVYVMGD